MQVLVHTANAQIYDRDGREAGVLEGHTAAVWEAKFSADGKYILTASKDNTARLWNHKGKLLNVLKGHVDIPLVSISPNGKNILAIGDETSRIWDSKGKLLGILECRYAEFSPDGNLLVAMLKGNTPCVYRVPR